MDLKKISEILIRTFEEREVRYALIGGLALGLLGVRRPTENLNFLVHRDSIDEVDRIMLSLEYEPLMRSENCSRYTSPLAAFGEVDFLHAFRPATLEMLDRAQPIEAFDGAMTIRVVLPEDLIGLKVQALANDVRRRASDLADIEAILQAHGAALDWEKIGTYFALFDLNPLFSDLEREFRT
jgi:hypothetical protein